MNFRRFNIVFNLPGRQNPWALFLLLFSVSSLIHGLTTTHWMASLRKGDSIIPCKDELTRIGPFSMSVIKTRNSILVGFASPGGRIIYTENTNGFLIPPSAMVDLIRNYSGRPVAFLLTSRKNPMREIWGINVAGFEILLYERAVSDYKEGDSSAYSFFYRPSHVQYGFLYQ